MLSYAGHTEVDVLRASPGADEPIVRSGAAAAARPEDMIAVHGADGGLAFGLNINRTAHHTVFDATFYRPVNTTYTGANLTPCRK